MFRVGARLLAADAADVAAVARRPALTRVPQAPVALAGLGALKGRATPVIELAELLGGDSGDGAQLLVLQGEDPVAVAVDHIEGIRERDDDAAEWLDLREMIAHVFQKTAVREPSAAAAASVAETRANEGERELSFVQFMLAGQRFAFPIAEVQAVVRAPAELVAIPRGGPRRARVDDFRRAPAPGCGAGGPAGASGAGAEPGMPAVCGGDRRRRGWAAGSSGRWAPYGSRAALLVPRPWR